MARYQLHVASVLRGNKVKKKNVEGRHTQRENLSNLRVLWKKNYHWITYIYMYINVF